MGQGPTADRRVLPGHAPVAAGWECVDGDGYVYWVTGTDHLVHQPTLWADWDGADGDRATDEADADGEPAR